MGKRLTISELVRQLARELLKRPAHRRGPYIITDKELRRTIESGGRDG